MAPSRCRAACTTRTAREKAARLAKKVKGVTSVDNKLKLFSENLVPEVAHSGKHHRQP